MRQAVADTFKAVLDPHRKALGQRHLVPGQHIDHVVRITGEDRQARCILRQAPQDQRRRQRDRIEGARGQAEKIAIGQPCGNDSDAGGKLGEGIAELAGIEFGRASTGDLRKHRASIELLLIMPKNPAGRACRQRAGRRLPGFALKSKETDAGEHHGYGDGDTGRRLLLVPKGNNKIKTYLKSIAYLIFP
jgi:hypothetical protein